LGVAVFTAQSTKNNTPRPAGDITQTQHDSAVLLYRTNVNDIWHTIPYAQQGNWKIGRFTVSDLQTGQYTIGAIDKSTLSLGEYYVDQQLFPNPAQDQVTLQWTSNNSGEVKIFNQNLQLVKTININNTDKVTFSVDGLTSGLYFIECNAVMHKLIIK
jgi:hypothetical protein